MQQGGASGGRHLSVQEDDPLLGNEEVDSTGLVAPSFLHFSALGPENVRPVEEQVGSTGVWFSALDPPVKSACGLWFPACPQSLPPTALQSGDGGELYFMPRDSTHSHKYIC